VLPFSAHPRGPAGPAQRGRLSWLSVVKPEWFAGVPWSALVALPMWVSRA